MQETIRAALLRNVFVVAVASVISVFVSLGASVAPCATAVSATPATVPKPPMSKKSSIRIACRGDIPRLEEIDFDSSIIPYTYQQWEAILHDLNKLVVVCENSKGILGFCEIQPLKSISIVKICVAPECRRKGHGSSIIAYIKKLLFTERHTQINAIIPDSELATHKFLHKHSFECIRVCQDFFEDKDGYLFVWNQELNSVALTAT